MWVSAAARSTILNSTVLQPSCMHILPGEGVAHASSPRLQPHGSGNPTCGEDTDVLIERVRHRLKPVCSTMHRQAARRNPIAPTTLMVAGSEPARPGAGGTA